MGKGEGNRDAPGRIKPLPLHPYPFPFLIEE